MYTRKYTKQLYIQTVMLHTPISIQATSLDQKNEKQNALATYYVLDKITKVAYNRTLKTMSTGKVIDQCE